MTTGTSHTYHWAVFDDSRVGGMYYFVWEVPNNILVNSGRKVVPFVLIMLIVQLGRAWEHGAGVRQLNM